MKIHPAFKPVDCKYGAPMGRLPQGDSPTTDRLYVACWVPSPCGAYDQGGAYWGIGKPVYCAWSKEGFRRYFRCGTKKIALQIADQHRDKRKKTKSRNEKEKRTN